MVAAATEIAMKNHRQEKLDALRNIVKHTAEGFQIDEVLRNTFLSLVDRFSSLHIALLRIHEDPRKQPDILQRASGMVMGGFLDLVRPCFSGVGSSTLNEAEADLVSEKLINSINNVTASAAGLMASHTTERGKAFLRFIS